MQFKGKRLTLVSRQRNCASPEQVFPLLCPVREKDWLDGWDYQLIYSDSGVAEEHAVFHTEQQVTSTWVVSYYQPPTHLGLVRVTPGENVAVIDIQLSPIEHGQTETTVSYQYTGLNAKQNDYIMNHWPKDFEIQMEWWENSINHYLKTGEKLKKPRA